VVPQDACVLTHCNAGALATAGYGSALGVVRAATEQGKRVRVLADETRPFLQGARLTAWELLRDGIETTVITDSMAGASHARGEVDLVVVGADRIAANGDTANKIGTYTVAVLAREHGIPFYVAAPLVDDRPRHARRRHIPIEERDAREVTHSAVTAAGARGRARAEPGLRRHAARPHRRHHHRARHASPPRTSNRCGRRSRRSRPAAAVAWSRDTDARPRHRDLVRRDRGGRRVGDRRSVPSVGPAIERRGLAGVIHREWGGVVPELASRQHVRDICGVVDAALHEAAPR
jgi:hypothetical protein